MRTICCWGASHARLAASASTTTLELNRTDPEDAGTLSAVDAPDVELTSPARPLDQIWTGSEFGAAGCPVALIKVDVEGHESLVIAGAWETIEAHRPLLTLEVHTVDEFDALCEQLDPLGYSPAGVFNATPTIVFRPTSTKLMALVSPMCCT